MGLLAHPALYFRDGVPHVVMLALDSVGTPTGRPVVRALYDAGFQELVGPSAWALPPVDATRRPGVAQVGPHARQCQCAACLVAGRPVGVCMGAPANCLRQTARQTVQAAANP